MYFEYLKFLTAERKPFFRMFNLVRASRVGLRAATSQGSLVSRVTPLGVTQKRYQAAQAQRIGYKKKIINLHDSNDNYTLKIAQSKEQAKYHLLSSHDPTFLSTYHINFVFRNRSEYIMLECFFYL